MGTREIAEAFMGAFEAGDFATAASYLSDNFQFSGPVPEPISGQEWLGLAAGMKAAFPDLTYNFHVTGVDGNVARTSSQVSGTHTEEWDLSMMGIGVIPPTGKTFSNTQEDGEGVVEGDQIVSIHIYAVEGSGLMGIFAQLGIQPPG
jgi:hypothetical protein